VTSLVGNALQVTVVIALALAAFGWFSAERTYERDSAALRQEVERLSQAAAIHAEKMITEKISTAQSNATAAATKAAKSVEATLRAEVTDLAKEVWWGRYQHHQAEVSRFEGKYERDPSKAFLAHLESIEAIANAGRESSYGVFGDEIDAMIRNISAGAKLSSHEVSRLEDAFTKMDATLRRAIDRLRAAIRASQG
jgi:hypothetical protein